ncbi:MAG: GNAT family N-acetyltransferase [Sediminibacterium sp. Gen4]|uniref:GNAT family N-acetyltransferase n=1 Tax=unclassified Sediminibacterium TaxID=2635961 RepID=UPI0015C03CC1|nr:GNAT family N-acetyltransferase [Sediminibacterium sp.]MBW0160096.1 GNAT family N-acetyltransferase [Sediminibacterium sp.]MBW0163695.1 GNAT family N-acetyltransferase [Sediminibacterium sp.]NWK67494.1 GNAT family N-acetyltransferase [Sediminibacterium sp. Gen4]
MTYSIICRQWLAADLSNLLSYLHHLNEETKARFGPHPFTKEALEYHYYHPDYMGFLLIENNSTFIIGYAILKMGYLEHDLPRLLSYNIQPNHTTDATYAPSLANDWQGKGIGNLLWDTVKIYLQQLPKKRVILWGGVQTSNTRALRYYEKNGFVPLGEFKFGGTTNRDMLCIL